MAPCNARQSNSMGNCLPADQLHFFVLKQSYIYPSGFCRMRRLNCNGTEKWHYRSGDKEIKR